MTTTKETLIGYALIALALVIGHACTQKVVLDGADASAKSYTLITSDSVPGHQSRVERNGMSVYDDLMADGVVYKEDDVLDQPVMIKDTECGEFAVSREIYSDEISRYELLAI